MMKVLKDTYSSVLERPSRAIISVVRVVLEDTHTHTQQFR